MPKRSQSGPGRRKPARTSSQQSSERRTQGGRRPSSQSAPKRRESSGTGDKRFSQKSRFAKPGRTSNDAEKRSGKFTGSEKPQRSVRASKPEGRFRPEGSSRSEKPFRSDKSARSEKSPRAKRGFKEERASDSEKSLRSERPFKSDRPYKKTIRRAPSKSSSPPHRRHLKAADEPAKSDKVRLNKYIANSGVSSRREADELIQMGLISVNGKIVSELGFKVSPGDEVRYEDRVLKSEKPVYILMNKPKGFITTTDDPQDRKTVMHIIGTSVKERIYPVGRLDRNTTGLLLLTNDGDLADKLMHPSFNVKKVYKVELDKALTKNDFNKVLEGVRLEEGRATVDDLAIVSEDGRTVGIELHIGWNRVVRRIFESLEYEVLKLDRTVYAGLDKKELARGQWRFLDQQEIIQLKHFK